MMMSARSPSEEVVSTARVHAVERRLTLPSLELVRQGGDLAASILIFRANISVLPLHLRVLSRNGSKLLTEAFSILLGMVAFILSSSELGESILKLDLDAVSIGLRTGDSEAHLSDSSTNTVQFVVPLGNFVLTLAQLVERGGKLNEQSFNLLLASLEFPAMVMVLILLTLERLGDFINAKEELFSLLLEAVPVGHEARPVLFERRCFLGSIGHQLN